MNSLFKHLASAGSLALAASLAGSLAHAETAAPAASNGIASKLIVRGELQGLQTVDLRSQRRNDILVVQAELTNTETKDLRLYYRFRWTDVDGMQVGDGEVWKPLVFLGKQSQFIKGTAPTAKALDFKIEMSAEPR